MKTKIKPVYYCDHCSKHGLSKHWMEYHEKICKKNPENDRPCYRCKNLSEEKVDIDVYCGDDWARSRGVKVLSCKKRECYLYPPQCAIKKNVLEIENNHEMPKVCEFFDKPTYFGFSF